jgi:hypothetical protein
MFNLNGIAGSYDVGLSNVVISNSIGMNILTAFYPGYVKITSPDISGESNIDFGEVSVLDTISFDYQLSNTGNDTLFVNDFFSLESYFWNDTSLPQSIPPFDSLTFNLKFHNINKGQYSTKFTIRSNDPDEDPFYIDALASSFAPNYILIQNAEAFVGDTVTLKIDVNNYEQFYDFQVDLDFPDSLTYVTNSASLTNRKQDHIIFENILSPNKIRFFSYSASHLPFLGDSGTVALINFVVRNDTGTFPLDLSGGILYDSNTQNIIRGIIDGEIYVKERPRFQLTVSIANGWNMVSVPGINSDGQGVDIWWPGRDPAGNVFKYFSGYITISSTVPGEGYWMKHSGANIYNTGDEWPVEGIQSYPHYPISAVAGWNLIGCYEDTIQTADLTTSPPGLISGSIFGYSEGYEIVANLLPGYAYWIKLTGAGQINFPTVLSKVNEQVVEYFKEDWGKIIITDNTGRSYTLYSVNGVVNLDNYELPPVPPSGMYDIRFSGDRVAEDISSTTRSIDMNGIAYPITVRVEGMNIRLQDMTGTLINEDIKSGGEITISNSSINKLMVSGQLIPYVYVLEQNYPNPFNPVTKIKYGIPKTERVELTIYSVLGERLTTLVNEEQEAGYYTVEWDGSKVSSGVYLYTVKAGDSFNVKKMLLLK